MAVKIKVVQTHLGLGSHDLLSFLRYFALEKLYWPGKIQFKSQIVSD